MSKKVSFPEGEITNIHGKCIVLRGDDIDTDRIIPARFLKCVSFKDLGEQVFADDRKELKGLHPFDQKNYKNASILIVNDNFGCGSSREHAPQALMRWGIRGIVGQSFAEIFYGNCLALGIPCAIASQKIIKIIQDIAIKKTDLFWDLDLRQQQLINDIGCWQVEIQKGTLKMLTTGRWDATSQLISQQEALMKVQESLPYLNQFEQG